MTCKIKYYIKNKRRKKILEENWGKDEKWLKNLRQKIKEELNRLKIMIAKEEEKTTIEKQRKQLDNLLEIYLKDL